MPSKLFGSKNQEQTTKSIGIQPKRIRSSFGNSSLNSDINTAGTVTNSLSLDPIIEQLRNESLSGFRSLLGSLNSDIDSLRGNQNAFIDARVNPLQEQFAESRGRLSRDTARRGVFGSLANNELERFDIGTGRALADQRALATNDALNAILQRENFQRQLFGDINTVAQQELSEALQGLGLQSNAANVLIQGNSSGNTGSTTTSTQSGNPGILGGLGTVLSLF